MSITLKNISSGYDLSSINANFQNLQTTLNSYVLWRNSLVAGEGKMARALDMDGNPILNADIDGSTITNDRALRVPAGEPTLAPLPPAADRANKLLAFDENGLPLAIIPSSESAADVLLALYSSSGSSLVRYKNPSTPDSVTRTVQSILTDNVSLKDFGAVGDGVTDDTAALVKGFAYAATGKTLEIPDGTYCFNTPIVTVPVNGFFIKGTKRGAVTLKYTGVSATADLITLDAPSEVYNIEIENIVFSSATDMTGGYALIMNNCSKVNLKGVCFGRLNTDRSLFNGVWFNDLQQGRYLDYELYVKGTGVTINGHPTTQHGADFWVRGGMAVSCTVAFNVAGGFGGFYIDEAVNFGCGRSVVVDNSKVANGNRELFFGPMFVSDGAFEAGIHLNDTYSNNSPVNIAGFIASSGTFGGSARRGIYIQAYTASRISINGAQIFNCKGDAVVVQDTTALVEIDSSTYINLNDAHGVYCPVPNGNVSVYARMYNNLLGDTFNVGGDGVWQEYAAANSYPESGGFVSATTSFRFIKDRRKISFKAEILVTANGTGASSIFTKLPYQPLGYISLSGINVNTGKALTGYATPASDLKIFYYDATYPAANNQRIVVFGTYEI